MTGRHRVTLLAAKDKDGKGLPTFDGSTWDPWAKRLLFTYEKGKEGGVWQATPDSPSTVEDISGALGRGGYEGIQNDSDGNLWIVEDVGGAAGATNTRRHHLRRDARHPHVRQRAEYALGHDPRDREERHGAVRRERAGEEDDATPFKRPENGVFQPGTGFSRFLFTETGDTDKLTDAGTDLGGFGTVQLLEQSSPSADTGTLRLFFQGDADHAGFDNIQFATRNLVAVAEDRGDTLHTQHNALDSAFLLDATADYGNPGAPQPVRFLAEGRDPSATVDSGLLGTPGFCRCSRDRAGATIARVAVPGHGACAGPSSTATTSPTRWSRGPEPAGAGQVRRPDAPPHRARAGGCTERSSAAAPALEAGLPSHPIRRHLKQWGVGSGREAGMGMQPRYSL